MKNEFHNTMSEVEEKIAVFNAANVDPSLFVPCLECGAPVSRDAATTPDHLFCKEQHHRRFKAKAKANGQDYGLIVKRAFRDLFHIGRGFDYRGKDFQDEMELLPESVAVLISKTNTIHPHRLQSYIDRNMSEIRSGKRNDFIFGRFKGNPRYLAFHEKVV